MKQILLTLLMSSFAFSGFYDASDKSEAKRSEYSENERLCKLFTKKTADYKKNMRDDVLATATLASYEHRVKMFCKRAEEAKKSL